MPKSKTSLKELLHEVRRVEKSREVLTEKRIRKIYKSLVTGLNGFLGNTYAKYADSDGRLSATILQEKGQYAKFLEEVVRNVDGISPEVKKEITGLVEETYKKCYTGMVDSVKTATANSPFAKTVADLSVQPTVLNTALNNNISKLTLPTVLEKHRQEVVYDIQQTLNVGLLNGDRYETMAKRITDRLDVSYGKATNIARTESHRNIEQGLMDGAEQVAPVFNEDEESNLVYAATWRTMLDERVRPNQVSKSKHGFKVTRNRKSKANHQKMEGQIIQVGGKFKLEAHVFAKCPGMSGTARNDCNCRCFLEYELLTKEEFEERNGKFLKGQVPKPIQPKATNGPVIEDTVVTKNDVYIDSTQKQYENYKTRLSDSMTLNEEEFRALKTKGGQEWIDLQQRYRYAGIDERLLKKNPQYNVLNIADGVPDTYKVQAKSYSSLQKDVIYKYTDGNGNCTAINTFVATGKANLSETEKWADILHDTLAQSSLPADTIVFRGTKRAYIDGLDELEGKIKLKDWKTRTIKTAAFSSTALYRDTMYSGEIELVVMVPKGVKGAAYVNDISHHHLNGIKDEHEVILQKDSIYTIIEAQYFNEKLFLVVKWLGGAS